MAKSAPKAKKPSKSEALKTNQKGEVVSWDRNSPDGKALKALFDGGLITDQTASQVKHDFVRFRIYAATTLNSALSNERKRMQKEIDSQMKRGANGEFVHHVPSMQTAASIEFAGDDQANP